MKMTKHVNVALFVPHAGCPHQCSFCNQKTISGSSVPLTPDNIHSAAETALKSGGKGGEIAFFGGSFTAIEPEYMLSLLSAATPHILSGDFSGIRVSTRPDAIDENILSILKDFRVTAIELGAQSTDDRVLTLNERGHTARQIRAAAAQIKAAGFETGLQMMTGLYGDTHISTLKTAMDFIEMHADTVRIYPTVVLEGTKLAELYRSGDFVPQTLPEAVSECAELLEMFNEANIPVIRMGLHSGGNVEDGYIAGAYHPAFRELCESEIYLNKAKKLIAENSLSGEITIYVPKGETSKMAGQHRCNLITLSRLGVHCKIRECADLRKYELRG